MSVVACKIYDSTIKFGADSVITYYDATKAVGQTSFVKLTKIKDMIIGAVGDCEEASMFYVFLKTHNPKSASVDDILELVVEFAAWKKERQGEHKIENWYVLGLPGKAFSIGGFFVDEIKTHVAVGSGYSFALAAMEMGLNPFEAVKVACKYNIYCSEPIIEIEIPRNV
jgi:ATP-dependent protease HslVU (ClpYQ) peptidase subunit